MAEYALSEQDRKLFALVVDATAANPFSPQRAQIDRTIAGVLSHTEWEKVIPQTVQMVAERLGAVEKKGGRRVQDFDVADRPVMMYTFLFEVYHRYRKPFEDFIEEQDKKPDQNVTAAFADTVIDDLLKRGFTKEKAIHFFSMFYQIRRGFYFIFHGLTGKSESMRRLRMNLWNNIFTYDIRDYTQNLWNRMEDFSTLLEGPTGSGKGAAAAAIGKSGYIPYDPVKKQFKTSFTKAFLPINLSQFAEGLLESELFGHTKGAFTGAVSTQPGVMELCSPHGSIFLDEIGEISEPAQVKLLKVLEERTFSPVGSHEMKRFYGRVIAATNRPIEQLRREGKFRDDFYYRLCSDCIPVPGLAQRVEENAKELEELVEHLIRQITGRADSTIAGRVLDVIDKRLGKHYPWPGNVRELAQCIRRVMLKHDYEGQLDYKQAPSNAFLAGVENGTLSADELLDGYCTQVYNRLKTYEETARVTGLDRRTVKKRVDSAKQ
ncbi:MAG: sigma 54-interacting transcriptional regulator [Planctomycetaceae bacterium]|nr:sigma 54-interacting transcriptional regulator [Planctomycetaceae bacterium]